MVSTYSVWWAPMHPSSPQRRVHSAEFKAEVLAECQRPGASVAAVALSHGLNVNLVRKWLVGRGLKRAGLGAVRTPSPTRSSRQISASAATGVAPPAALQFIPVELTTHDADGDAGETALEASPPGEASRDIHIELRRGGARLTVRWPSAQAGSCAGWLCDLAASLRK